MSFIAIISSIDWWYGEVEISRSNTMEVYAYINILYAVDIWTVRVINVVVKF